VLVIIIATYTDIKHKPELTDEAGSVSDDLASSTVGKFLRQAFGISRLESFSNLKSLQLGELDAFILQHQGLLSSLSSLSLGKIFKFNLVGIDILDELLNLQSALLKLESKTAGCKGTTIVSLLTCCGHKDSIATIFTARAMCGVSTADGEPQVAHGETIVGDWVVDSVWVCDYSVVDADLLGVGIESMKIVLDITRTSCGLDVPLALEFG
jgi:hypothetical protein